MLCDTDGADSGSTTTVGNTECLVEVEMADVSANLARRAETDLGVHVGSVHVHLAAVVVDNLASLLDTGFVNTEGTGVCNHDGRELVLVLLALGFEIREVQVTGLGVAFDRDDAHSRHRSASRVRSVGGNRDQANISLSTGVYLLELLDSQETGKLTLSTGVWLNCHLGHSCAIRQLLLDVVDHLVIAFDDIRRGEWVDGGKLGPSNRNHLSGRVELQGARSQRDHGVDERNILGDQVVDVSQHLCLGMVAVENRVRKVWGSSLQITLHLCLRHLRWELSGQREYRQDILQLLRPGCLIEGDTDLGGVDPSEIHSSVSGGIEERVSLGAAFKLHGQGVEENVTIRFDGNVETGLA